MAELDFSHHVSEVPAGAALPEPYQRQVGVEVVPTPNLQGAVEKYAENTNWLSDIGSQVAVRASSALAAKLGSEVGKNPHGDVGIPLTDFDKVFTESYNTQSHSTLGLQAQKLITDSNIELASIPRLTPELLHSKQNEVNKGLTNIIALAPSSIRASMEQQYGSVMLQQNEHLMNRMINEQREDMRNNNEVSTKNDTQNIFALSVSGIGLDADGNSTSAIEAVEAINKRFKAAVADRTATPLEAKVAGDSARQTFLSGKYTRQALIAEKEGKLPEFLRDFADKTPGDITSKDRDAVINNVVQYMNQQAALRSQDQQLKLSKFAVRLAENPGDVSNVEFAQLQSELTPIQAQKAKLDFIQALSRHKQDDQKTDLVISDWGNSNVHARVGAEAQNKGFDKLVQKVVSDNSATSAPVTREMAEVQVAMSAGAPIPVFQKSLEYKLQSGNPQLIESASQQMHALYSMGAAHALSGLDDKSKVMFDAYETLRANVQPTEAARDVISAIQNQKPEMIQANQEKWTHYLSTNTKGTTPSDFALSTFGLNKNDFLNPSIAHVYGTSILSKYETYYKLANGDETIAKKVTQRYIDQNYGDTYVNGGVNTTLHPLEKVLGYSSSSVVPFIHQDVISQLNQHFEPIKEAYKKGKTSEYWEVQTPSEEKRGFFGNKFDPVRVIRHSKTDKGEKSATFDVMLQGNAFDQWDVSVVTESGNFSLYQIAPYLGYISYTPDKKSIDENYLKATTQEPVKPYIGRGF